MQALWDFAVTWTAYDFMRLAMAAVLLIAPLFALLGTMVVDGRMAFFADSLGHSAMTGVALGVLLGLKTPLWAMLLFGIAYAALLTYVKARGSASTDTTIGVFSATGMALGVVLLSRNGGFSKYSGYLIGDLLSITPGELIAAAVVLGITLLYWVFCYNRLLLVSVSGALSASRGVRVRLIELSFACLLAVVVMLSIRWVGILIISALLVLPSAAARNLARSVRGYHFWAIGIALCCSVLGLLLSFVWDTASGATIVLALAAVYLITLLPGIKR
ncbi:MAG: metal ABC transporter permease [Oscillospiraceae bacterium]|jgi:zinc transport system permease protein|nr:metal ABC transporter permease [Oscillospiraceae bacterium]